MAGAERYDGSIFLILFCMFDGMKSAPGIRVSARDGQEPDIMNSRFFNMHIFDLGDGGVGYA